MPNIKISAAADAGTLLSSDMVPLARSGNTNAYHATMTEIATFTNASVAAGAYGNVGRNLLHNPLFNVAQRGAGPFTTAAYTLDRWLCSKGADATSVLQVAATDAMRAAIGDESCTNIIQNTYTGTSGANDNVFFEQRIENVRRLANTTVTVSFWAAISGGSKIGINIVQYFGTGGSPSAPLNVQTTGASVTASAAWARYSATFVVPSVSGKTLGTNNDSGTWLRIFSSSGATNNQSAGNIGVQSGAIQLWGIQLEVGTVATPLDYGGSPADQLRQCQRFYQTADILIAAYASGAGMTCGNTISLPVTMRATPTVAQTSGAGSTNVGTVGYVASPGKIQATASSSAAGGFIIQVSVTASADL